MSHTPWAPASSSNPRPCTPPPPPPQFTSSFNAFGLPQPRTTTTATPSNLSLQLERASGVNGCAGGITSGAGWGNHQAVTTPGGSVLFGTAAGGFGWTGPAQGAVPGGANGTRRASMLAADAIMMEDSSSGDEAEAAAGVAGQETMELGKRRRGPTADGDEGMTMSPAPPASSSSLHPPPVPSTFSHSLHSRRSRSHSSSSTASHSSHHHSHSHAHPHPTTFSSFNFPSFTPAYPFPPTASTSSSVSGSGNVPPSPVTLARALQFGAGQKTPPPFLQRRLFKDAREEEMENGRGRGSRSRSGSSTSSVAPSSNAKGNGKGKGKGKATQPQQIAASALASALLDDAEGEDHEDYEIEELSQTLRRSIRHGSGSGTGEDPNGGGGERVVRRPVSRKPNLLPKPKSHLRILTALQAESLPADSAEIASEATLHRLSRAGASCPSSLSGSASTSTSAGLEASFASSSNSATILPSLIGAGSTEPLATAAFGSPFGLPGAGASLVAGSAAIGVGAGGGGFGGGSRRPPPPNRFPEHAAERGEDEDSDLLLLHREVSSSGSSDGGGGGIAPTGGIGGEGSDWGYMSDDERDREREERRNEVVWNGIRGRGRRGEVQIAFGGVAGHGVVGRSPRPERLAGGGGAGGGGGMDVEFAMPQTPSSHVSTQGGRPGKRKIHDDRFEPYANQAFKRRAVSPAASLSLSPGFHAPQPPSAPSPCYSTYRSKNPTPPPIPPSSLGSAQPLPIPSSPRLGVGVGVPIGSGTSSTAAPHHQFFSALSHPHPITQSASTSTSLSSSSGTTLSGSARGFSQFVLSDRHRPISAREEMERRREEVRRVMEERVEGVAGLGGMSLGTGAGGPGTGAEEEGGEEEL
ncbi:hypothetical protein JCM11641_006461 [Rhodosporidiobolus odoratus]